MGLMVLTMAVSEQICLNESRSELTVKKNIFENVEKGDNVVHAVFIGTKPDIIKQFPLISELKRQNKQVVVIHSGQHYDWSLSGGLEEEFDIVPDLNLNVRGSLYEQQSQIIQRAGFVMQKFKQMKKQVIPYTYGDTTTALAGGIATYANGYPTAHVEAGLRTMSPANSIFLSLLKDFDVGSYCEKLKQGKFWSKGSYEPFPEQFDTRASAPSASVHLTPHEFNASHLIAEGYDLQRIHTVGNPVVDAIRSIEKNKTDSNIFERYPKLEEGDFIRFCIHRRENVMSRHRFSVLINAMISLIKRGENVLLISLGATEKALKEFGFSNKIVELADTHKNFVYSPVWPYYRDVVAAMKKCRTVATDSGSIQEETNILGIPGVVLRFNTDRPEAVFSGSNVLAPPIKSDVVEKIISFVNGDVDLRKSMKGQKNIYGDGVSKKIISVIDRMVADESFFRLFEHERLGFDKLNFWEKGDIVW